MRRVRIKVVFYGCDFRFGDKGLWEWLQKQKHYKGDLKDGEAYLLVSCKSDQILWVYGQWELGSGRLLLDTQRWRLPDGRLFEPDEILEYASMSGIQLIGWRDVLAAHDSWRAKVRAARRAQRKERKEQTNAE